ncbi:MAG: helix-turn-helix transcriptional regulator [Ruminococcaceae bacterium]|nr:helix-turn-helix transcriptional regulator [Oscillospiraceae bacterium]
MYEKPRLISNYDINIVEVSSVAKEKYSTTWKYSKEFTKKMYKIAYVLNGEYVAYVNNKKYYLKDNDILYSGGFKKFSSYSITNNFSGIYIYFIVGDSMAEEDSFFYDIHQIKGNENIKKKFTAILNEYNSKSYNHKLKTKKILYEIFEDVLDAKLMTNNTNIDFYPLKNAISYLEQNYLKNDISINYLANLCNYTPAHFINLFKRIYDTTPKNYIIDLRMQKAKDLLIYTPYSILEISNITGYSNPAYFSAAFKASVGCSPLDYRKKNS